LEGIIEYWHITTGEQARLGIDGGLIKRQGKESAEEMMINSYVCIIDVPDKINISNRYRSMVAEWLLKRELYPT
jgi:hypothetical protein